MKLISFGDDIVKNSSSPKILADMLGYDFVDCSEPETSNQKIYRDVIKYICDNSTTNIFILIGWTDGKRFEVHYDEEQFIFNPDKKEYPIDNFRILDKHQHIIFNDILIAQHRASEAFTLQNTLANLKINYYMYNTQDSIYFNEKTLFYLKGLSGRHYHNPLNKSSSMQHFLLKEDANNPDEYWANFLFNKIRIEDKK